MGDIGIRVALLSLAALLLMALHLAGRLQPIQSALTQLSSPAQLGTTGMVERLADTLDFLAELRTLRQRNSELEQINSSLLVENFRLREVERENQQFREMLAFAETRPSLELRGAQIRARVIGEESNNFLDYINLDLGAEHGIAVGMPVVTEQGLVGRISEVTSSTSKVLLITDVSSAVNAILQSSRLNGVLRGGPGGELVMEYIQQGAILSEGEIVLTSGLGGAFPKGIPIGQVTDIRQRDIDVFQQAVIQPTVDFGSLELVMVVTNFDPLEVVPELAPVPALPAEPVEGEEAEEGAEEEDAAQQGAGQADAPALQGQPAVIQPEAQPFTPQEAPPPAAEGEGAAQP